MSNALIVTLVGQDRPGLVEKLAEAISAHGGSWQASNMSQLSGQFAGILQIDIDADKAQALTAALNDLPGLQVVVASGQGVIEPISRSAALEITANDRPGIVRDISQVLARHGVNVEQLVTQAESAPNWGHALFRAKLSLSLPAAVDGDVLTTDLESLADDLVVDIRFDDEP